MPEGAVPCAPLETLRDIADLPPQLPPPSEILKLFFAAVRLHNEDRWSNLQVIKHQELDLWALRGEHFSEAFESCQPELVIPLEASDTLCLSRHDKVAQAFGVDRLFYALVDADGDVVLYSLEPASLQLAPEQRPLSEPSYVEPAVLAAVAAAAGQGGSSDDTDMPLMTLSVNISSISGLHEQSKPPFVLHVSVIVAGVNVEAVSQRSQPDKINSEELVLIISRLHGQDVPIEQISAITNLQLDTIKSVFDTDGTNAACITALACKETHVDVGRLIQIIVNMRVHDLSLEQIGQTVSLHPKQVESILSAKDMLDSVQIFTQAREVTHPTFANKMSLRFRWNEKLNAHVRLELQDRAACQIGDIFSVPIAELVLNACSNELTGPFRISDSVALQGSICVTCQKQDRADAVNTTRRNKGHQGKSALQRQQQDGKQDAGAAPGQPGKKRRRKDAA